MRTLLKVLGIVVVTAVALLVALAAIGYAKGGKRQEARALRLSQAQAAARTVAEQASTKPASPTTPTAITPTAITPATAATATTTNPPGNPGVSPAASGLIAKLDGLEAQGKHADAAVEAFNAAPTCSAAERTELIAWLKARVKDGQMPAMYWIARAYASGGDMSEATKWYAAAGLTGRVDAARLTDVSAGSAVPAIETHFAEVKKSLKDDAGLRRAAIRWALEYEESVKDRAVAAWIAAHGMQAFNSGPPGVVGDDQWQAKREGIRKAWRELASAQ